VVAALLISVRQGVWLRSRLDGAAQPQQNLQQMMEALAADIAVIQEDRMLEPDLRRLLERIRVKQWQLYE
jgi:histidine ammonia-lyase